MLKFKTYIQIVKFLIQKNCFENKISKSFNEIYQIVLMKNNL